MLYAYIIASICIEPNGNVSAMMAGRHHQSIQHHSQGHACTYMKGRQRLVLC